MAPEEVFSLYSRRWEASRRCISYLKIHRWEEQWSKWKTFCLHNLYTLEVEQPEDANVAGGAELVGVVAKFSKQEM